MLVRTSISVVHDVGDVVDGVGNTDVMIVRPGTALGLLDHVEDGNDQPWLLPRDEWCRKGAVLVELLLPWLQWRPCGG